VRADEQRTIPPVQARVLARIQDDGPDAVIVRESLADPELFAILVRRHAPALQRYVTRRIGAGAAEDVVAETFLVAFRQRVGYADGGHDCLPWLYGIATRLVHRHWRSESPSYGCWPAPGSTPSLSRSPSEWTRLSARPQ
jgi:DNA-directed RNA polymerase specialized sigma24 family protein